MRRRSFLGSLPALSVAPAAGSAAELPPELRELIRYGEPEERGERPNCGSLREVISKIQDFVRENPGCTVLPADEPAQIAVGITAFLDDPNGEKRTYQSVRMTRMLSEPLPDEVREAFKTVEGKTKIVAAIGRGETFV